MQETTETQKCSDRIKDSLRSREERISALMLADSEDALLELYELPVGIETVKETTVTLSWGGPADYLHVVHAQGEVKRVTYRFSDWYDTAIDELDETSPLWEYAEYIVETMGLED